MTRVLALVVFLLSFGCQQEPKPGDVVGNPDDPVTLVEADDPEMAAAEQTARETLDDFIQALQNPTPLQSDFGVKTSFADDGEVEHMWVSDLTYADGAFSGRLGNDPYLVKNIKNGDPVVVKRSDVEDWLYYDGEDIVGGYTAKLLMSRQ